MDDTVRAARARQLARLSDGEYRNGTATLVVNAAPVVSPAMASSLPPSISGATRQGSTLFASSGHWTSDPASLGYQWQRCTGPGGVCAAIPQAVHHWYKLVRADVGAKIRVQVSAKSSAGSAQAVSATFGPVAPALASVAAIETALNGVPVPRGLAPLKIRNVLADDAPDSGLAWT